MVRSVYQLPRLAPVAVFLCATAGTAQIAPGVPLPRSSPGTGPQAVASWPLPGPLARLDRNGNGLLDGDERAADPRLARADTDGDGVVGFLEASVALARQRHAREHPGFRRPPDIPVQARSPNNPLADLRFFDELPSGRRDPEGRYLGATETMDFVAHGGVLFASTGVWMDQPYGRDKGEDPWTGAQVLRKDAPGAAWRVDVGFPGGVRVGALHEAVFTRGAGGRPLPDTVRVLLAAPGGEGNLTWARDDANGRWAASRSVGEGRGGFRSLATHGDGVTGEEGLFGGTTRGEIFRGSFDPAVPGQVRWDPVPELAAGGRVMALAEANGRLYAAVGIESDEEESGGLFVRRDGADPRWERVWRWPYRLREEGDESEILRGLTPLPAPDGEGEVFLAYASYPGVVYRIDPRGSEVTATVELDVRAHFARAFGVRAYAGPSLGAYNAITPMIHPDTGERLHLIGLWIREPGRRGEAQGAHFLVRREDGSYGHGRIEPLGGQSLESVRAVAVSPFAADSGRVLYFGGYDCAKRPSHNTAWMARGVLPSWESAVLVSLDGLDRDVVTELMAAGRLPNLRALADAGTAVSLDITDHPTMTKTSHAILLTGLGPMETGVVDNRHFQPIPEGLTLFDHFQGHRGAEAVHTAFVASKEGNVGGRGPRQAQEDILRKFRSTARNAAPQAAAQGADLAWVRSIRGEPFFLTRRSLDLFDSAHRTADQTGPLALEALKGCRDAPCLVFLHFADPDVAGHRSGHDSPEYRQAAELCDAWVGRILQQIRSDGLEDRTLVYVVTDHGFDPHGKNHLWAPHSWMVTNDRSVARSGELYDVPATILHRLGVAPGPGLPRLRGTPLDGPPPSGRR